MHILNTGARFSAVRFSPVINPSRTPLRSRYFIVRSLLSFSSNRFLHLLLLLSVTHLIRFRFYLLRANLPFPKHQAKYHKELETAIDAVDRACRLCVDVSSIFTSVVSQFQISVPLKFGFLTNVLGQKITFFF